MAEPNWEDLLASQGGQWWNNVQTNLGNFGAGVAKSFNNLDFSKLNDPKSGVGYAPEYPSSINPFTAGFAFTGTPLPNALTRYTTPKAQGASNASGPGDQFNRQMNLNPTPQMGAQQDTYLNLLYSLLEQSKGTGGYGSALSSIQNERKGVNSRYKENQGDIKNMFGNLTTMRRGDIAGVSQLAETGRAQSAEQTGAIAQQTRDAEAQRLAAANQARAALGLGEIAGAAAGGDIATQASEAGLADQAALAQIGQTASQTNQSITEQAINDEIARYSTEQDESLRTLGRSRDTALSDIAGREQQVLMQQASAQQAAQQASTQLQLQIAGLVNEYQAGKVDPNSESGALAQWVSQYAGNDPQAQIAGATASGAFWNWIQNADQLMGNDGKPLDAIGAVNAFAKYDPETAALLQADPSLNFLLTGIWNAALTKPKAQ